MSNVWNKFIFTAKTKFGKGKYADLIIYIKVGVWLTTFLFIERKYNFLYKGKTFHDTQITIFTFYDIRIWIFTEFHTTFHYKFSLWVKINVYCEIYINTRLQTYFLWPILPFLGAFQILSK